MRGKRLQSVCNRCCFPLKVENIFKTIKRVILRQVAPQRPPGLGMSQGGREEGTVICTHSPTHKRLGLWIQPVSATRGTST
uniref:Uncharacterized protein n=1 Tax=Bubo bubo TaxID=30461 RepID=A0A8C0IEM4_BUBBB